MKVIIHKPTLLIYLAVVVASVVFASFYGGPVAYGWLYAMLLLLPLSVGYTALNYHWLRIYQELDVHKVTRGERHTYKVMLENTGIFPIYRMELHLLTDRCIFDAMEDGSKVTLGAREKMEETSDLQCRYAGAYNVGIESITLSDPFHIYEVRLPIPYTYRAVVKPPITDMANRVLEVENRRNQLGLKSDYLPEEIAGSDMRAYHPGDSLHSIHWKVSAKQSELMVRIPEKMEKRTVTILLQAANAPEDSQDIEFLKKRDFFLEFIVSAAWQFGEQGVPVNLIYPFGQVTESLVNSKESFQEFYDVMADGIFYGSESAYDEIQQLARERGSHTYETDTWIIIREDPKPGEAFYTICD